MSKSILKSAPITRGNGESYQLIRDSKGAPEYYLVPVVDFHKLTARADEDADLVAAANAARHDETFPAAVAERLVTGETPLKVIREWRGLTQSRLGGKAHVPSQYISQIERGNREMGKAVARRLSEALGVSVEVLMDL